MILARIKNRLLWKSCVTVFVSFVLFLSIDAYAEVKVYSDAPQQQGICFSNEDAGRMVVELENYEKQKEMIELLKEENVELEKKIENMQKISEFQDSQLATANETIKKLNELQETQKKAYEKQIEEVKPSFFDKLKLVGSGVLIGFGGLAVIIAVL